MAHLANLAFHCQNRFVERPVSSLPSLSCVTVEAIFSVIPYGVDGDFKSLEIVFVSQIQPVEVECAP
jgi:hypothetical protein